MLPPRCGGVAQLVPPALLPAQGAALLPHTSSPPLPRCQDFGSTPGQPNAEQGGATQVLPLPHNSNYPGALIH